MSTPLGWVLVIANYMPSFLPESLHATSMPYHSNISKKKPSADPYPDDGANPKEQLFAGEALGQVMISHGEEMLRDHVGDRQYAERLEKFGRARCKIAAVRMKRSQSHVHMLKSCCRCKTSMQAESGKAMFPEWRVHLPSCKSIRLCERSWILEGMYLACIRHS